MTTPTPLNALKSLSGLALSVPAVEPLIVYDSVAILATKLGETSPASPPDGDFQALAGKAAATAKAIRAADQCQLAFREMLGGVEE